MIYFLDPTVAWLLVLLGFYGIVFELANPGTLYPGVVGAIALLLGLFLLQELSLNYTGLGLMLLGIALIVGEALVPGFGILGSGGLVAFVLGSMLLLEGSAQQVSLPAVGGSAALMAGLMLWTVHRLMRLRRRTPATGAEHLPLESAEALDDFAAHEEGGYHGHARLGGERWNAHSEVPVQAGQVLQVQPRGPG
jgi:membrane-bound serine protease (ClpP class)